MKSNGMKYLSIPGVMCCGLSILLIMIFIRKNRAASYCIVMFEKFDDNLSYLDDDSCCSEYNLCGRFTLSASFLLVEVYAPDLNTQGRQRPPFFMQYQWERPPS